MNFRSAVFDTTRLVIGSFILWMTIEALRPGAISHWWNLSNHFIAAIILLVLTLKWPPDQRESANTQATKWWNVAWAVLGGAAMSLMLKSWGGVAIVWGLLTFLSILLLAQNLYDSRRKN